jgi:hypothetical protein
VRARCDCGNLRTYDLYEITRSAYYDGVRMLRQPRRSCGCLRREAFSRKLNRVVEALPSGTRVTFVEAAQLMGTVKAAELCGISKYVAGRLIRRYKNTVVTQDRARVENLALSHRSLLETLHFELKRAIRIVRQPNRCYPGEFFAWELARRKGHSRFDWCFEMLNTLNWDFLLLGTRRLASQFMAICIYTFRMREERRRKYLKEHPYQPRPKLKDLFGDTFSEVLLPGLAFPSRA